MKMSNLLTVSLPEAYRLEHVTGVRKVIGSISTRIFFRVVPCLGQTERVCIIQMFT